MPAVEVLFRGKAADKVWKKAHTRALYKYKDGSGTNMRTGEMDISFSGPCPAMKKVAKAFNRMKGVRVRLFQGGEYGLAPVQRFKCGRGK